MLDAFETPKLAISAAQAAELLSVSKPTIYQMMKIEGFPVFKVGGRTLISTQGLAEWVKAQAGCDGGTQHDW